MFSVCQIPTSVSVLVFQNIRYRFGFFDIPIPVLWTLVSTCTHGELGFKARLCYRTTVFPRGKQFQNTSGKQNSIFQRGKKSRENRNCFPERKHFFFNLVETEVSFPERKDRKKPRGKQNVKKCFFHVTSPRSHRKKVTYLT